MEPLDLTSMSDVEFDALRREVAVEQERRATVASASGLISDVVSSAVKAGVAQETIDAAVTAGLTPED